MQFIQWKESKCGFTNNTKGENLVGQSKCSFLSLPEASKLNGCQNFSSV